MKYYELSNRRAVIYISRQFSYAPIIDSLVSSSIVSLKANKKRCIKKLELRIPSCCEKQDGGEENTALF